MSEVIKTLADSFLNLTNIELDRLAYHSERKTPICCGQLYELFTDGSGGG